MITLDEAKEMFYEMVSKSEKKYRIKQIWEIQFEEPLYVMMVVDENGEQFFPGEVFPCINKKDGSLSDWTYPPMG